MDITEERKDGEKIVTKVARDLELFIPKTREPLAVKIIALFTLAGGLSLLGSTFTDIFGLNVSMSVYILRALMGFIAMAIAYGLVRGMRWTIYLYAIVVLVAIMVNPKFSVLLAVILVYLVYNRKYLKKSAIDAHFESIYEEQNKRKI